jgi:hypothetical protein
MEEGERTLPSDAATFRDILVFEEAIRTQQNLLGERKRKYLFFFAGLLLWDGYFFYGVFISPSQVCLCD